MTRPRRRIELDAVGDAFASRNVWLLVASVEVMLTLISPVPGDVRNPTLDLLAGLASSAVLLGVIWCGWILGLRRLVGLQRLALGVPLLVVAGVSRGVVLQSLLVAWGLSEPGASGYRYRVMASVLVVVVGGTAGALVKLALDGHRSRLEILGSEQRRLALVLRQSNARLRREQNDAVESVANSLIVSLAAIDGSSPSLAIDSLEQIATQVVRPLSHELLEATPTWQPPTEEDSHREVDRSQVWESMASLHSVEPVGPALVTLLVSPTSMVILGLWPALLLHGVAAVAVYAGLALLRTAGRVLPEPKRIQPRIAVTTALLVLACTPAAVVATHFAGPSPEWVIAAYLVIVIPVVALLFSFIRATRVQQAAIDLEIRRTVERTRWWVCRVRMTQWWQEATLARALHGPVQTALHAAVRRLQGAVDAGRATPEFVNEVVADLRALLPTVVLNRNAATSLRAELDALGKTWKPLVAITSTVSEDAAALLEQDPVCSEIVINIAGESVSNAIRHGRARTLSIDLGVTDPGQVSVVVVDDGRGWAPTQSTTSELTATRPPPDSVGLGVRQLDACTLSWGYSCLGGRNVMRANLPAVGAFTGDSS